MEFGDRRLSFFSVVVAFILINASYMGMDLDLYNPGTNQGSQVLLRSGASNGTAAAAAYVPEAWDLEAPRPLIHVFNPYVDASSSSNFYPIGLTQWIMMASVHNAKQVYKRHRRTNQFESRPAFDSVMTVCATFEHEVQALTSILSYYCDHVRILSRSTATEYQWLDKHIPFLDDIIEAGKSVVQKDSEYYLMYTNADINADEDLFIFTERNLRKDGGEDLQYLNIIRRTIPVENVPVLKKLDGDGASYELGSLEVKHQAVMHALDQSRSALSMGLSLKHSGHDCMTIRSDVLSMIHFGDLLISLPPWSGVVNSWMLNVMARRNRVVSPSVFGTFHIGDARKWVPSRVKRGELKAAVDMHRVSDLRDIYHCPPGSRWLPHDAYSVQQWINCGKLFKLVNGTNGTNIAAYVIPGNENVFLTRQGGLFRPERSHWTKQSARLNGFFNLYVGDRTDPVE